MLAKLTDAPFDDRGWIFEDKYDGFRMVATIEQGRVTLYSRNGKIISDNYIEVAKALEGMKHDAVLDGELVAIGSDGLSHFQLLQNARRHEAKLQYCVFDLMFQDGDDLRGLPLVERKKRLKAILPKHKLIAFSDHRATFGTKFYREADRNGLEGIMAKRSDSQYLSGVRTDDWLKIKTSKRQEAVVAGFTAPKDATVFRSPRARRARGQGMAVCRSRRRWFQLRDSKRTSPQADQIEDCEVPFFKKGQRGSCYYLGEAYTCGGSKVHRVDELRRNASSRLFGA